MKKIISQFQYFCKIWWIYWAKNENLIIALFVFSSISYSTSAVEIYNHTRFYFDHMKYNLSLGIMLFKIKVNKDVHFLFTNPLLSPPTRIFKYHCLHFWTQCNCVFRIMITIFTCQVFVIDRNHSQNYNLIVWRIHQNKSKQKVLSFLSRRLSKPSKLMPKGKKK